MPKLIQVDGFHRENIADILILDKLTHVQALILCEAYCKAFGNDEVWFQAVNDNYVLSRGIEDLV